VLNGGPPNPKIHPFWNPEFFGDVNAVNGRSWPFLDVEPRRYRFRVLDAANARMYRMRLVDSSTGVNGPAIWQIGSDGGLLDRPVKLADGPNTLPLFLATGERADVIVDFAGQNGRTFTLTNDAEAPFPSGDSPDPATAGRVMQFRVRRPLQSRDDTFNPASGGTLRGGRNQEPIIVRLANPSAGSLAAGVRPSVKRQLVLVEVEGDGGPIEVLLNNTRWDGIRDDTRRAIPDSRPDQFGQGNFLTELPRVGSTEVWEVANLTEDAHPIHVHLIQFQVINRQALARDPTSQELLYRAHYDQQFPGGAFSGQRADLTWGPVTYPPGVYIPEYGPPRDYGDANRDDAVGGNPSF
jgi:spore coat protein A